MAMPWDGGSPSPATAGNIIPRPRDRAAVAARAAAQAATISRFGVLNIDDGCLLIIITTSLMVNYCFGLLWLNVYVTASFLFKICVDVY